MLQRLKISWGMNMSKKHVGSDFDEFLEEQGVREVVTAQAIKCVIVWQIAKATKAKKMTRSALASRGDRREQE